MVDPAPPQASGYLETRYVGFMWCGEGAAWTLFALPGKAWILSKSVHWFA